MKFILAIEEYLVRTEKVLLVFLLFLMVALSFLQVVMRAVFSSGIMWADPFLRHVVMWTGMLGAVLASRYGKQFALDAVIEFFPERIRRFCEIVSVLFTAAVCGLLFFASYKFLRDEFTYGSTAFTIGSLPVEAGWLELIIPAAFLLVLFHTLLGIFRPASASGHTQNKGLCPSEGTGVPPAQQ
ncbi:MAG: TRAP transporter small permease [bacterium]